MLRFKVALGIQGCAARIAGYTFAVFLCSPFLTDDALAVSFGMVADNSSNMVRMFDTETGDVVASLKNAGGRINGDCALSKDESVGFSSSAGRHISVFQFSESASGKVIDFSSIDISNAGVDMSLSPDGRLLVSTGAGNTHEPLSIIDTNTRVELAASALFLDHTSAEFCDDGTLLVTTTYGNSFAQPFDNAMYDASVAPGGKLQLGGNRLSSGAQPNNGSCAPGSKSGVLLDRNAGLTSFTLPGLHKVDYVKLHGRSAISAVFNESGTRLYVRTSDAVEAFDFNPNTGMMRSDWVQYVPFSSEYFGIDQIAIDMDSGKLYVDGGQSLLILDPDSGDQTGLIHTGDATGVCFAQRGQKTPVVKLASNAP